MTASILLAQWSSVSASLRSNTSQGNGVRIQVSTALTSKLTPVEQYF